MAGRKPKYNDKIVERICALIETDTYTVAEICRVAGIHRATYFEWINEKPEFADAIKKAQEARTEVMAVAAERSLKKLVEGYTVEETSITSVGAGRFDANGKEIARIKEQKTVKKHFQPNPAAVFFTLCNARPERWKNRQLNEVTGKDGKELFAKLTDEELDAKIADYERRNNQ